MNPWGSSADPASLLREVFIMPRSRLQLHSPAFDHGESIPRRYTGEGPDLSPPLAWSEVPPEAKELAVICDDPDAPTPQPWVHWVLCGLSPGSRTLEEGEHGKAIEGANDFGRTGYGGPMPPKGHGVHHYHFKLYALDAKLGLEPGVTKAKALAAMQGHIVAEGELMGTYERR
jgi:Raf kinase inhibitor-like YbhB/YbcL family protein